LKFLIAAKLSFWGASKISLNNEQVIYLLRIIGNNLTLGKSIEKSLYIALNNLEYEKSEVNKWIRLLNLGKSSNELFNELAKATKDHSLARIWTLLAKISFLSSFETGEKVLEIVENLEKNRLLTEKRNGLLKAQKYKIFFLGSMTSIFLGIIAGLAPLFATFVSIFRNVVISEKVLYAIPFSLFAITIVSTYFISDTGLGKFNFKVLIFSSLAYAIVYFITKAILLVIM
jgi:hypothetical protein